MPLVKQRPIWVIVCYSLLFILLFRVGGGRADHEVTRHVVSLEGRRGCGSRHDLRLKQSCQQWRQDDERNKFLVHDNPPSRSRMGCNQAATGYRRELTGEFGICDTSPPFSRDCGRPFSAVGLRALFKPNVFAIRRATWVRQDHGLLI